MATEKVIDHTKEDSKTFVEQPSDPVNSDEDAGKDSDVDMIFDEIARENTDSNDKSNDSLDDNSAKPKSTMKTNTPKKAVRGGRFIRRGTGRGFMHRVVKLRLPKIPEGILYVKNGTYIGYHCTYCNCALKTLLSVKQHVAGARHRETLGTKKINEGGTTGKNTSSASPIKKAISKNDLKSSLDEYLAAATEPIVGLGHIVETVSPDKPPSFECSLCKFSCNSDEMKEHISGTRHRLMYLKTVEPKKIAEMMSKNLNKSERNQKIIDHAKELEGKYGRGSIDVRSNETAETPDEELKEEKPDAGSSGKPMRNRGSSLRRPFGFSGRQTHSMRRARDWVRGRGRGLIRGGRLGSIHRGMRGIRGGRRPMIRGGRRGNLARGRIMKRSLSRMNSERRKQSIAKRFRGRGARGGMDPYVARDSYYADYADWVMRTGNDSYENFYGREPYYPDPYSMPREPYMEDPYERIDRMAPRELYPRHDYRPSYEDELPREYGPPVVFRNRDRRSTSPSRNISSQYKPESVDTDANPLKNLPNFNVASEKDAGIVMNVITSLAENLLGYKMHGSVSPQEILQRLDEEKKKSSGRSNKSDTRAAEKFSKAGDAMDPPLHNWNEIGETRTRHSGTYDTSTRGWTGHSSQDKQDVIQERTPPPPRRQMDAIRDRSPPRRPMDIIRDRSPPPPRRPVDIRDRSPPPPRRPVDIIRDRSPPPKRPMDIMRDRSPPISRRPVDLMRNRSPPQPRGPLGVMRDRSPPLSRRSVDVMRNRSPPPRGSIGIMQDRRSPPPPRSHPSYVDDMFDDYQKSQSAVRGGYASTPSNAPTGYRSSFSTPSNYGTPASYASPFNANSSFNRSSEGRRLPSTGGFGDSQERNVLDWKYRSLR